MDLVIVYRNFLTGLMHRVSSTIFLDRPPMKTSAPYPGFSRTNRYFYAGQALWADCDNAIPASYQEKFDESFSGCIQAGNAESSAPSLEDKNKRQSLKKAGLKV
ncbi:hypothetical protein [Turicimonas muris]|uniref:hypothetical protein n=1 Tax=Turicimonas muris TaxID=1796652 RepID=UPI003F6686F2